MRKKTAKGHAKKPGKVGHDIGPGSKKVGFTAGNKAKAKNPKKPTHDKGPIGGPTLGIGSAKKMLAERDKHVPSMRRNKEGKC